MLGCWLQRQQTAIVVPHTLARGIVTQQPLMLRPRL